MVDRITCLTDPAHEGSGFHYLIPLKVVSLSGIAS